MAGGEGTILEFWVYGQALYSFEWSGGVDRVQSPWQKTGAAATRTNARLARPKTERSMDRQYP